MSKYQDGSKWRGQVQEVVVNFLSVVCVGSAYSLIAISLVQAYILVSWLKS